MIEAVEAAHHRSHGGQRQCEILHQRSPDLLFRFRGRAGGARRGGITVSLVGGIALQLGIDQPVILADAGERIHDRPTEVGIDLEASEDLDAVQQAAHNG